jgi:sec-independent protein translocase protein TatC
MSPAEAFMVRMKVAAAMAVLVASPVILFQAWSFVSVALDIAERRWIMGVLPASFLLFYAGVALAVFGITPIAARFLLAFGGPFLQPLITLDSYLSFVIWMSLGFGLFFQVPVAVVVLSRMGVINPWRLAAYRAHVLVATLVIAAVLTPGPDIISQLMLAIPSYVLFEASLIVARRVSRPGRQ